MFRFRLVIAGIVIGDEEPSILGSAIYRLKNLRRTGEEAVDVVTDPDSMLSALRADDELHDLTVLSIAESLDGWSLYGFRSGGDVVFLAQPYVDGDEPAGAVTCSRISEEEYLPLVEAVDHYWRTGNQSVGTCT